MTLSSDQDASEEGTPSTLMEDLSHPPLERVFKKHTRETPLEQ